ncbi:glycosyltransferase [uncultured Chryseobacterium sp.]|uniref:glycosyltransferase n=1 Tax=uncultured Chryseobacterium sp. TaxID=259322 RepID=UPI002616B489|nr:glycosyltransferase [uncultured Chryseobacterium sp.]
MLSIIISSYQAHYFSALEKNIAETIGIPYEIIKIENPGIMGICEAYNKGAEKSKFEHLLFLHEDVRFDNLNWGNILMDKYFQLQNVGILGLAGDKVKFHLPYGFSSGLIKLGYMFVKHKEGDAKHFLIPQNPLKVKPMDGVFLAMKKDVWNRLKFDESIKGYHFYDLDITLRSSEHYQNYLVHDIDFLHFSTGNFGTEWVNACIKFNKRIYSSYDYVAPKQKRDIRKFWYKKLSGEKINFGTRLQYMISMGANKDTLQDALAFLLPAYQLSEYKEKFRRSIYPYWTSKEEKM